MKTPTEVDFRNVAGAAELAGVRIPEPNGLAPGGLGEADAAARATPPFRLAGGALGERGAVGSRGESSERLSIDPMRATDRYRLVMPIDPHL